jgi:phosphohistidine phosphatase SixA
VTRNPRRLAAMSFLLGTLLLAALPAAAVDTIYLVRHAEKAAAWPDPPEAADLIPLSPAGERRAEALAARLKDAGIGAVYTSRTTRAIATAMPLVGAGKIPLVIDEATTKREEMSAFFTRVRQKAAAARAVLIVGHSNTVPDLLIALGATKDCYPRLGIREEQGDRLIDGYEGVWRVELTKSGCEGMVREELAAGS